MIDQPTNLTFDDLLASSPPPPIIPIETLVSIPAFDGKTMSSLLIAEITGKNHADVMRDIRNTLEQAEIGESKFASTYTDTQNKSRPYYTLPRRECDLVISGYSVKYRIAIIDRWHELEARPQPVALPSYAESLRELANSLEKNAELEQKIEEQAPKVRVYDDLMESDTDCSMATAAQLIGFGQNRLFEKLRTMGVLISGGSRHNLPKQRYIELGLFNVKEGCYVKDRETVVTFTTTVTQKGVSFLIQNLGKKQKNS